MRARTREIAHEAGHAEGTLYKHFESKIATGVNVKSKCVILKPFARISWEELMRGIDGVFRGVFNRTKAVLPLMQQQRYGRIVYIGSGVGNMTGAYAPVKSGMTMD